MLFLLGALSLLAGLILLAGAAKQVQGGTSTFLPFLIAGICAMVLGAVVFLNPGLIEAFIAVILGFACLVIGLGIAGAGIFQEASTLRRILTFASGCLIAALGILFLLHPQGAAGLTLRFAGLFLAAAGVVLLAAGIRAGWRRDPLDNPEYRVIEER